VMMRIRPLELRLGKKSMSEQMREGWDYVRHHRPIRAVLILFSLNSLMGYSYMVLLPVIASQELHGGANTLGLLTGASGVGAFISALSLTLRTSVAGLARMVQIASALLGLGLMMLGLTHTLWVALALMVFIGFGMMQNAAASNTIVQSLVDDEKRARVMGYYSMAFFGAAPFGSLMAGVLAEHIGVNNTVIFTGLCCALGALWFMFELPATKAALGARR
jgi:predicted MFS family arabinose efflux permease